MKIESIDKELIFKITRKVPNREKAIFTIMRQTGLTPEVIKKLKHKHLEQTSQIPRAINASEFLQNKIPIFIGEEANIYLERYLATRENVTPESLLFCSNEGTPIDVKNLSRSFRQTLEAIKKENKLNSKLDAKQLLTTPKHSKLSLYSLVRFYQENTKLYEKAVKDNPHEYFEIYRKIYREKAMPFLEIETLISIRLTKRQLHNELSNRDYRIKEMKQTIARDSEYISSILTLLYNNKGNYETGENEKIGDDFIELWKETEALQGKHLMDFWNSRDGTFLDYVDILEEFTKTLKRIKKRHDKLEQKLALIQKKKA